MTLLGFLVTLIFAGLIFSRSRQVAAVTLIAAVCYTTQGQVVSVFGLHFTSIRIILLAGFIRILARRELNQLRFNAVDRALLIYAFTIAIISTMRVGTISEMIYRLGCLFDVILSYSAFRCFIREERELCEILVKVAYLIVPFALLIVLESLTAWNPYSLLGGVFEHSWIRDGQVRAAGAFRDPITAGSFGATFVMLFAGGRFAGMSWRQVIPGLAAGATIALCGRSSGPLLGLSIGLIALACWKVRRHTGIICWGTVAVLIILQLTMKVPVWFLISRAGDVFGGGGWHRAYLIDQFFNHFSSWWLAGTSDTDDWFPYQLAGGGADLTNRFVMDGVDAGLIGLISSVLLVAKCFRRLRSALRARRGNRSGTGKMLWVLGSTLVATVVILFSVTYFDQMELIWFFLLACIAGAKIETNQTDYSFWRREARLAPPWRESSAETALARSPYL